MFKAKTIKIKIFKGSFTFFKKKFFQDYAIQIIAN